MSQIAIEAYGGDRTENVRKVVPEKQRKTTDVKDGNKSVDSNGDVGKTCENYGVGKSSSAASIGNGNDSACEPLPDTVKSENQKATDTPSANGTQSGTQLQSGKRYDEEKTIFTAKYPTSTPNVVNMTMGVPCNKVRKPYTITKQRERWTDEEHKRFLEALKNYGRQWRRIEGIIFTLQSPLFHPACPIPVRPYHD